MFVATRACVVRPAGVRGDVLRFTPGQSIGSLPDRWVKAMVERGEAYEVAEIQPPNGRSGEPVPAPPDKQKARRKSGQVSDNTKREESQNG
jgi:hypothetical protein